MQLLREASTPGASKEDCAHDVLDAIPSVMQVIRGQMRKHRSGLTVPQFRTLYFISMTQGGSLSAAADFIGLSLPAMSRMIDGLVEKRLVLRRTCDADRRHVRLALTDLGSKTLKEARGMALEHMAGIFGTLPPEQRASISSAMRLLQGLFGPEKIVVDSQQDDSRALPAERAHAPVSS